MEEYIGVFDTDPVYRGCLMRGLLAKDKLPLSLVEFTKPESILIFAREKSLTALLISPMALTREILEADIKGIILLTEEAEEKFGEVDNKILGCVFKYQSVGKIAASLAEFYTQTSTAALALGVFNQTSAAKIYAVYSPIKRCMKSAFAIALAQILGDENATLLISFEEFSALSLMLDAHEGATTPNLSDALYYYLEGTLPEHIPEIFFSSHGFDFIYPVKTPEDLESLAPEDVVGFLQFLAKECRYSFLVVDFGDKLLGISKSLSCASRVFMPVREGAVSERKKELYFEYVRRIRPELLPKLTEVRPPYYHRAKEHVTGTKKLDELLMGEFYDYVRSCL